MATEQRLIDANALITYFEGQCDIAAKDTEKESLYVLAALKCCIDFFQNFPTVDAVEVVRCRECKYWDKDFNWCDKKRIHMEADDFCSYGERKANG